MNSPRDRVSDGSETVVCVGERARIATVLGGRHVDALFQGSVTYRNDATNPDYLGVWGARNGSRLRRLLKEAGIDLVVRRTRPPGATLRVARRIYESAE